MKKKKTIIGIACLAMLAAAGYVAVVRSRTRKHKEVPPPGAPQLDVQNPGDQSAFPAAPSGEKDLG